MTRHMLLLGSVILAPGSALGVQPDAALRAPNAALVASARTEEQRRIELIARLTRSVVCVFDEMRTGSGSGIIIDADGTALTNYHVIQGMMETRRGLAGLSDGTLRPIRILGVDPTGDVAMFRIEGGDRYSAVALGDSDELAIGEPVLALGNPFSLADDYTPTVTLGTVGGLHRYQPGIDGQLVYTDSIQVDASINPGNSGGPLFNLRGELVGINGRISVERRGQVNVGLGYAIPINQIKRFLDDLRAGRTCRHGTMEATVTSDGPGHAVFDIVRKDGPAWRAGLRPGDRPLLVDRTRIYSAHRYRSLMGTYPAGWRLRITYERAGERRETTVRLGGKEDQAQDETDESSLVDPVRASEGAEVETTLEGPAFALPGAREAAASILKLYGVRAAYQEGYGSAVIVTRDGKAVTTLSLLLEGESLRVVTRDGREFPARVLRRDHQTQMALLELELPAGSTGDFAAVRLGSATELRIGDWIVSVSNAFDVSAAGEPVSVTLGVVGGRIPLDARRGRQPFAYRGPVLLIDAISSNPGAPGGGVFNRAGELVGILGKTVTSNLTNTLLNYAIPVEVIREFLQADKADASLEVAKLENSESPLRETGFSGMRLFELGFRQKLVYVDRVVAGSPAARADVRTDDLIVAVNGERIRNIRDYRRVADRIRAGQSMRLTVKRGEEILLLSFELEPLP